MVTLFIFGLQPMKFGFEQGHHGWVSADGLAIISRANIKNDFVGYISKDKTVDGFEYHYFDRYPPFFSGTMNTLLKPFEGDFSKYILSARMLMNVIFILTLFFGYQFLRYFITDRKKALGICLIVFSGHYFIHYKDMIHFDQPAILGNILILWAIGQFKIFGRKKLLYAAAIIIPLWGRGYSSIFFLLAWNIVEFLSTKELTINFWEKLKGHMISPKFISLVISVPLTASFLLYNLSIEAKTRNISILETSIADSAMRRLGLKKLIKKKEKSSKWSSFIPKQIDRQKDMLVPEAFSLFAKERKEVSSKEYYLRRLPAEITGIIILFLFLASFKKYFRSLDQDKKILYLTAIFSGFVWLYTMRKLAAFHDYTTLYYIGFSLLAYTTILQNRFEKVRAHNILAIGLVTFLSSLGANYYKNMEIVEKVNHQSVDFNKIRTELIATGGEPVIYFQGADPKGGSKF